MKRKHHTAKDHGTTNHGHTSESAPTNVEWDSACVTLGGYWVGTLTSPSCGVHVTTQVNNGIDRRAVTSEVVGMGSWDRGWRAKRRSQRDTFLNAVQVSIQYTRASKECCNMGCGGRRDGEGYGGFELGSVHPTPTLVGRPSLASSTQCWSPRRDTPRRVTKFSGHQGARRRQ